MRKYDVFEESGSPSYRSFGRSMYDFGYMIGKIIRFGGLFLAGYIGGSIVRALFKVFFG